MSAPAAPPATSVGAVLSRPAGFLSSTVGKKIVMAITGLVLFGFVVAHLVGNLQVFLGPEALDAYAVFLREFLHGAGLWIARAVLLAATALHIWAATSLTLASRRARPLGYRLQQARESTYASRTMVWSGPILLLFIVYHLMHLTFGNVHPQFVEGRVYHNLVAGLSVWPVALFYVVAQLALGLHLYHGGWSLLQTLGLSHPRWNRVRFAAAFGFTAFVTAGNVLIPVAVLAGWVKP